VLAVAFSTCCVLVALDGVLCGAVAVWAGAVRDLAQALALVQQCMDVRRSTCRMALAIPATKGGLPLAAPALLQLSLSRSGTDSPACPRQGNRGNKTGTKQNKGSGRVRCSDVRPPAAN
jgi:hypothetical protein